MNLYHSYICVAVCACFPYQLSFYRYEIHSCLSFFLVENFGVMATIVAIDT